MGRTQVALSPTAGPHRATLIGLDFPRMNINQRLFSIVESHPHHLLFISLSGGHLYGFPSPDSDFDLRGAHAAPVTGPGGNAANDQRVEISKIDVGLEVDLVTNDANFFATQLIRGDAEIFEQVYSPLILRTTPEHAELREIAKPYLSKAVVIHYGALADNYWKQVRSNELIRLKPLLHCLRALLAGIHLARTGEIEPNLITLNERHKLDYLGSLIAAKLVGSESDSAQNLEISFLEQEYIRLGEELATALKESALPDSPPSANRMERFVLSLHEEGRSAA